MIPKKSTPIKNEILIDIFAKGLLTKDEMRIVSYIIRWSWGFDGQHRRQDYTKELTKRQIANDIGMDEGHLNRNINKMIAENKLTDKEGCYQFNEHYTNWKNLTISQVEKTKKLDEKSSKTCQLVKQNLTNSQVKLDEKSSSTDLKPLQDKPLPDRKETKRNLKETIKTKDIVFIKAWKDFKEMRKKIKKPMTEKAEEMLLNSLNKLSDDYKVQVAILNQSIFHCWQGVFPLKGDPQDDENQPKYIAKAKQKFTPEQIAHNIARAKELAEGKFNMPETAKGGEVT